MAKTLVLGIGTTGLRIIEEAQQYHYEFTGRNKPGDNVAYLYIETDTSRVPKSTAGGESEIESVMFDFDKVQVDIDILKKEKMIDSSWIPSVNYLEQSHLGAGGMPSFGRLSLWKTRNYQNIRSTIERKFHEIKGDKDTIILVVGTLTGGTGSGLAVDMGYLIQDILPNNVKNLNSLFLLPDRSSLIEDIALHENSYSAISAITHYSDPKNEYKIVWPDKSKFKTFAPPYQLCHYLSQDFSNGNASIMDLGELIKVAGMHVLLNIINTNSPGNFFQDTINRRRIDQAGASRLGNQLTSGFMMVQYPKAQLKELLALKISEDLINSICNTETYISLSKSKKLIKSHQPNFESDACKEFEKIVDKSMLTFDNIMSTNDLIISDDIDYQVDQIMKGDLDLPEERILFNLSNTTQNDNYYMLFKSNILNFKNSIIDNLHDYAVSITDRYKNLHITKIHFTRITDYISELQQFYLENYKLDGNDENWDNHLGILIDSLHKNNLDYKLVFQKKKYYRFIISECISSLKIHCIVKELGKLKDELLQDKIVTSLSGTTLPSIPYISSLINKINLLASGDEPNLMTLKRRRSELAGSLDKYSTNFKMLYVSGNKELDLEDALSKYNKEGDFIDFSALFSNNIWNFSKGDVTDMYRTVIKNSVDFINNKSFFTSNLIEIINKINPDQNLETRKLINLFKAPKEIIKQELPALLGIANNFALGSDDKSKLHVITSDYNNYNKIFTQYKVDPNEDNTTDLADLKDVIVYYQEYATTTNLDEPLLDVTLHLNTLESIKQHINDSLKRDDDKKTNIYINKKSPYFNRKELNKIIS